MTPAARVAAAAGVLDAWLGGQPAEKALIQWARGARYAGSADRAAVRDHVFAALRCRRSLAALGGADTGRGLMLGALRAAGADPAAVFTGEGHAPAPLSAAEAAHLATPVAMSEAEALDCPDWLAPRLAADLGADFAAVLTALRARAPVFLRVNSARITRDAARAALAREGVETAPVAAVATALEVLENCRSIKGSRVYRDGLVELQDAASQAVVAALPLGCGIRVLDFCAGGGGKALAIAARLAAEGLGGSVLAHDAIPRRMADLPARAARAGVSVPILETAEGSFDLVLADAPCSGSGAWRRSPEGKWLLTPEGLGRLTATQDGILDAAAACVAAGGVLAYATCSLLRAENEDRIAAFHERHPDWRVQSVQRWSPLDGADGFFLALLTRG